MNWFDWTILGAVVVLWLRLEVLFHKHDVLRGECSRWSNESEKEVRELRRRLELPSPWATQFGLDHVWSLTRDAIDLMNERLNKLDPPRRRSTDKKAAKR